jgi:plastocyanin
VVCPTSIEAGDTVRWEYPSSGLLIHTTTECGADCAAPTLTPLWDSGIMEAGDSFEFTFTELGQYLYYCTFHQSAQLGLIRILEPQSAPTPTPTATSSPPPTPTPLDPLGDVNCNGAVDSIDAALVLQLGAGLIDSLACQQNADVNGDGAINAIDAALILQFVAGLIDSLGPGEQEVAVSLVQFDVVPDQTSIIDGPVAFQVSNDGSVVHNFRVIRTGLDPDALPVDDATFMVDVDQVDVVARSENLNPGETEAVAVDLAPGSYVLICNIPTHYQAGMFTGFTVQ